MKPEHAGKRGKCSACGAPVRVPELVAPEVVELVVPEIVELVVPEIVEEELLNREAVNEDAGSGFRQPARPDGGRQRVEAKVWPAQRPSRQEMGRRVWRARDILIVAFVAALLTLAFVVALLPAAVELLRPIKVLCGLSGIALLGGGMVLCVRFRGKPVRVPMVVGVWLAVVGFLLIIKSSYGSIYMFFADIFLLVVFLFSEIFGTALEVFLEVLRG